MEALTIAAFKELAWAVAGGFMALIGGAAVLYGGVRYGIVPGVKGLRATLDNLEAASELIKAQLNHNDGHSLVDRVKNIDETLKVGCPLFDDDKLCPRAVVAGD